MAETNTLKQAQTTSQSKIPKIQVPIRPTKTPKSTNSEIQTCQPETKIINKQSTDPTNVPKLRETPKKQNRKKKQKQWQRQTH